MSAHRRAKFHGFIPGQGKLGRAEIRASAVQDTPPFRFLGAGPGGTGGSVCRELWVLVPLLSSQWFIDSHKGKCGNEDIRGSINRQSKLGKSVNESNKCSINQQPQPLRVFNLEAICHQPIPDIYSRLRSLPTNHRSR